MVLRTDTREQRVLERVRLTPSGRHGSAVSLRQIPSPAWSEDSQRVFYSSLNEETKEYYIKSISLGDMTRKTIMPSSNGRIWGAARQSTLATLSHSGIVLYETKTGTQRCVTCPEAAGAEIVAFDSDLSTGAILSGRSIILVGLATGERRCIPNGDDVGSMLDIALSHNGNRLYCLVHTPPLVDRNRGSAYQVRVADMQTDKTVTLFNCPDVGRASILSVSPDEKRVFIVMQYDSRAGKRGFCLVGDSGGTLVEIAIPSTCAGPYAPQAEP